MRPKGVIVYRSPNNLVAEEARRNQKQKQLQRQERAAARAARPVPNYLCYRELFAGRVDENGNWIGPGKLPRCRKCDRWLEPKQNHQCPGFRPKFSDRDPKDRMELRKAAWLEGDGDWDDDQYDETTPDDREWWEHEAETGETRDQVVIDGMTEEEYLMRRFGYLP